jgi:hypothetical protein
MNSQSTYSHTNNLTLSCRHQNIINQDVLCLKNYGYTVKIQAVSESKQNVHTKF